MHICACIHNLAAGEAAVMRAAGAGCERQAGLPKRLRTQPGTPKPLSGRRRARRGAEGPGARESGDSRQGSGQSNKQTAPAAANSKAIKETDVRIRFFWFCFLLIFAAIFAFLMRFFICFLCVFYVFFVLCPPLAGLSLLFLYGTLHISAHISAYQVCPAAAALRIRGADPFLRIFRFPQYSL